MELPVIVTPMAPEREHALVAQARAVKVHRAVRALRGAMAEGTTNAA
jgi:hypothetical protein